MDASSTRAVSPWPYSPADLRLTGDEIHVWCAALDELAPGLSSFAETLSSSECDRAERFRFERDRTRFIIRHGLLRMLLGRYLDIEPARLSFNCEPRGKPVLSGLASGQTLHFNLSHSDGVALFGFARLFPLGVDIERIRSVPEADEIAAKFFSTRESAVLNAAAVEQKLESFFNCWTRKEAYLKATGEGIADALPLIEVSIAPDQPAQLLSIAGDTQAASGWSLHAFMPLPGFVGAMAVKQSDVKLACWQWARAVGGRGTQPVLTRTVMRQRID